ncbi:hypothetical protein QVN42_16080 [Yersinia nurmii]|uniref:Uncharacterized protein n=1 Tax=Yersinia nurmii TaxID=685706 RepID=A0AAW7K172_9GAMM|nr:hypothetical protein [Yersinia nurmii]MDN0088873.1 hypothetical protein [Yersinia nurmii]
MNNQNTNEVGINKGNTISLEKKFPEDIAYELVNNIKINNLKNLKEAYKVISENLNGNDNNTKSSIIVHANALLQSTDSKEDKALSSNIATPLLINDSVINKTVKEFTSSILNNQLSYIESDDEDEIF